jgi:hypothetical protein
MNILKNILNKLSSQIRKPDDKLTKKVVSKPKIQDNDQSIKLGAINEEHQSNLRSVGKTGTGRRRIKKS